MDKTLILVKKDEDYLNKLLEIIKKSEMKVCYVTFNKTPNYIIESAEKYNIPKEKFYFIDCITARIKSPEKINNSVYISDFDNLENIRNNILQITKEDYHLVIFDSISNILIYPSINDNKIAGFIKSQLNHAENNNGELVFVCYDKDVGNYSLDKTIALFNRIKKPFKLFCE